MKKHVNIETLENYQIMTKENKFMKTLIACGVTYELLTDFEWNIEELEPHKYHCIGVHPVASRIDIIKSNIVIH